jgi:hypothetical protein
MTMPEIGHNNPPSQIEATNETAKTLSDWLAEHPVIETDEAVREAKLLIDRGKLAAQDLEAERDILVRPLNERVKEINAEYKPASRIIETVVITLQTRATAFLRAEEAKRIHAAQDAARRAEEAERAARAASSAAQDAIASDSTGELGTNIAAAVTAANRAIADFNRAEREAARAERDTKVKIGGGFKNALSLRQKETLIVQDHQAAIKALGLTDKISAAILSDARAFRTEYGELPPGIISKKEREL